MNTETGQILDLLEVQKLELMEQAKFIPIDENLLTTKQKEQKQVSLFDNRSPLGKIRVQHRNSLRNKPCPCGSGIKFKNCCWNKTC